MGGSLAAHGQKMDRQNPASNPQETSQTGDPELARWLTRDLRPKGAPLSSPPASAPAPPPSEAEVLAGWLTQDLTPKNSLLPRASVPPSERPTAARMTPVPTRAVSFPASPFRDVRGSEPPGPLPSPQPPVQAPVAAAAAAPAAAPPVAAPPAAAAPAAAHVALDSLAPQVVTPDPPSLPVVAPVGLDDDDLAVLPGRRRSVGSDRKRYAFVLLGALCFAAAIGLGIRQRGGGDAGVAASMGSPTDVTGALPPPPPSAEELLATPEPPPAEPPPRRAKAASDEPDDGDPLDPRNALGGPSVRRYADVPSPTLSRLAREQRRLARERDEAKRKAKAKEIPR
jgi:hypothetical protein